MAGVYRVQLTPAAERDLLRIKDRTALNRIGQAIDSLAANPRPRGAKVLQGSSVLRIRIGDYRILYTVEDASIVLVARVRHRREVYR